MIIEVKGDIFDILEQYDLDAIVNPVTGTALRVIVLE